MWAMCGIGGKILFNNNQFQKKEEIRNIRRVLFLLHHRGPDSTGYILKNNYWLANTRLSIVDLSSKANQPFIHPSGKLSLVFNGEIYNWRQLKNKFLSNCRFKSASDTEVLLYLYEKMGAECLKLLHGMFAFAVFDEQKQSLFLARDRLGKKPLKYFYNRDFFLFASEIKALLNFSQVPQKIDYPALSDYFRLGYIPAPGTGFKEICKLPAGHYLMVSRTGKVEIKKYWHYQYSQSPNLSEDEWINKFTQSISQAVLIRLPEEVPWAVHLSGGVDSSIVAFLAARHSGKKIKTITVGFTDSNVDEIPYARKVADLIGSDHQEYYSKPNLEKLFPRITRQLEEPFADPSILPTHLLMGETKDKTKVILNGDGGDESFGGYPWYKYFKLLKLLAGFNYSGEIHGLLRLLYKLSQLRDFPTLSRYLDNFENRQEVNAFGTRSLLKKLLRLPAGPKKSVQTDLASLIKNDLNVYLPDDLLVKTDLLSMANSLEARSPLLDESLVHLASSLPLSLKINGLTSKYILKKIAARLMPGVDFSRKKQGFLPPLTVWFRQELKGYLLKELSDPWLYRDGFLNKETVQNIYYDHLRKNNDYSYILWILLCYKNWLKVFFS